MFDLLSALPIVENIQVLKTASSFCSDTREIWNFLGQIVKVLQIVIPVIIILLGTIDLGKAVMAGDDKKIKESQKMLIMRLVYGVAIFFVVVIVRVVFGLVGDKANPTSNSSAVCFKCVSDGC